VAIDDLVAFVSAIRVRAIPAGKMQTAKTALLHEDEGVITPGTPGQGWTVQLRLVFRTLASFGTNPGKTFLS
jgi:hypothetical protein